eukprot:GHVT01104968.1.p1 GENE.GHVT01104968.1~~GHVT01104968.1.p1  ORF type:complete len:124 (+),score=30.62 GHVT01104968.1:260-631(+)
MPVAGLAVLASMCPALGKAGGLAASQAAFVKGGGLASAKLASGSSFAVKGIGAGGAKMASFKETVKETVKAAAPAPEAAFMAPFSAALFGLGAPSLTSPTSRHDRTVKLSTRSTRQVAYNQFF